MTTSLDFSGVTFEDIPDIEDAPSSDDTTSTEGTPRTRQRRVRSDKGVPRGSAKTGTATRSTSSASSKRLAEDLLDPWAKLAKGLAFTSPTTAAVLIDRGEKTTAALVKIAEKHPRMMKALTNVGQIGPGADIAETLIMVFVALQIDSGRLPPNSPLAAAMGVAKLHRDMFGDTPEAVINQDGVEFVVAQPPVFNPGKIPGDDPRHPRYSFQARGGRPE